MNFMPQIQLDFSKLMANIIPGRGVSTNTEQGFATLLNQAENLLGKQALAGIKQADNPAKAATKLLQELQQIIIEQGEAAGGDGIKNPLHALFAQLDIQQKDVAALMEQYPRAQTADLPSLLVLKQVERELGKFDISLTELEGPDQLQQILQDRFELPPRVAEGITQAVELALHDVFRIHFEAAAPTQVPGANQLQLDADYMLNLAQDVRTKAEQAIPGAAQEHENKVTAAGDVAQVVRTVKAEVQAPVTPATPKAAPVTPQPEAVKAEPTPPQPAVLKIEQTQQPQAQAMAELLAGSDTGDVADELALPRQHGLAKGEVQFKIDPRAQTFIVDEATLSLKVSEAPASYLISPTGEVVESEQMFQQLQQLAQSAQGAKQVPLAKPLPPVFPQIQNSVDYLLNANGGEVKIKLNPANLGEIEIRLDIHDGVINGRIVAQSAEVLEQLARDVHHLQRQLNAHGLALGESGLEFALAQDQANAEAGSDETSSGERRQAAGSETGEDRADTETQPWRRLDGLVDVTV